MNEKSVREGVLVYDSHCNLCLATKAWFEKRDSSGKIEFASAHDVGLSSEFPQLQGFDLLAEITWIDKRGQLSRGADAIASALYHVRGWRWAASVLMLPGTRLLRQAVYRWIAKHRYHWFGRSCDSGTCNLRSDSVFEPISRFWPTVFSLSVIVLVTLPISQNFRRPGDARDNFPLSYYPMFSSKRENLYQQASVVAIKQNDETVPVHYEILGQGGLNQNRRQLGKLISVRKSEELRQYLSRVADQIAASDSPIYAGCVSVAAIKGTYDLNAYFTRQNQRPIKVKVILKLNLPSIHELSVDTKHLSN